MMYCVVRRLTLFHSHIGHIILVSYENRIISEVRFYDNGRSMDLYDSYLFVAGHHDHDMGKEDGSENKAFLDRRSDISFICNGTGTGDACDISRDTVVRFKVHYYAYVGICIRGMLCCRIL